MQPSERQWQSLIQIGFFVAILGGIAVWAFVADRRERALVESGACQTDVVEWFQPPPSYVCVSTNSQGTCTYQVPNTPDPYQRAHWVCEGGEQFWRRVED